MPTDSKGVWVQIIVDTSPRMGLAIRYTSCTAMSKGSEYRLVHGIVREIFPTSKPVSKVVYT